MISIIICSANKPVLDKAVESITNTIGVPFEIIIIENSTAKLGICDAYNQGFAKANYDILCFMHEDISFETLDWGQKVIEHLKDTSVGLIGVAGGDTKSWVPSSWASLIHTSEISYIQHFKHTRRPPQRIVRTNSPENNSTIKEVVCIDGFWMCARREVVAKYQFDAAIFTGFHGYDIDFSLQILQEYKVAVIFDVLVNHYSEGSFDTRWMENAMLLSDKWKEALPISVKNLPKETFLRQHWTSMRIFIDKLIELNYSLPTIGKYYLKYASGEFFHWKHFLHYLKYIFSEYFKKRAVRKQLSHLIGTS